MRHIIRGKPAPAARQACKAALLAHQQKFGDYGPQRHLVNYRIEIDCQRYSVEVVNRQNSYVATALTGHRHLGALPTEIG